MVQIYLICTMDIFQKGMVSIMSKYTGLECPVCKNTFKDDDDIVVCPECGAPYHRTCYQKEGHCIYEDKHGTDQAWQAEERAHQEAGDKKCPRCGTVNPSDSLYSSNPSAVSRTECWTNRYAISL